MMPRKLLVNGLKNLCWKNNGYKKKCYSKKKIQNNGFLYLNNINNNYKNNNIKILYI